MKIKTKDLVLTAIFTVLLIVGGKIVIPLGIVPLTLQTVFSLMTGALLGWRGAFRVHLLYLFMGLVGLPVFAKGGSIAYVLQPTFGYLLGMLVASFLVGFMVERLRPDRPRYRVLVIAACLAGLVVVYFCGVGYLFIISTVVLEKKLTLGQAVLAGIFPFLFTDTALVVIAGAVMPRLKRLIP